MTERKIGAVDGDELRVALAVKVADSRTQKNHEDDIEIGYRGALLELDKEIALGRFTLPLGPQESLAQPSAYKYVPTITTNNTVLGQGDAPKENRFKLGDLLSGEEWLIRLATEDGVAGANIAFKMGFLAGRAAPAPLDEGKDV